MNDGPIVGDARFFCCRIMEKRNNFCKILNKFSEIGCNTQKWAEFRDCLLLCIICDFFQCFLAPVEFFFAKFGVPSKTALFNLQSPTSTLDDWEEFFHFFDTALFQVADYNRVVQIICFSRFVFLGRDISRDDPEIILVNSKKLFSRNVKTKKIEIFSLFFRREISFVKKFTFLLFGQWCRWLRVQQQKI